MSNLPPGWGRKPAGNSPWGNPPKKPTVPQQNAPAAPVYPQQNAPAAPTYPQQNAPAAPAYPQQSAPAAPVYPQQSAPAAPVYPRQNAPAVPAYPQQNAPAPPVHPRQNVPEQPQENKPWVQAPSRSASASDSDKPWIHTHSSVAGATLEGEDLEANLDALSSEYEANQQLERDTVIKEYKRFALIGLQAAIALCTVTVIGVTAWSKLIKPRLHSQTAVENSVNDNQNAPDSEAAASGSESNRTEQAAGTPEQISGTSEQAPGTLETHKAVEMSELSGKEASSQNVFLVEEKSGCVKSYPASDLSKYPMFADTLKQQYGNSEGSSYPSLGYALCDINRDNNPELFVAYLPGFREDESYIADVFCISGGKVYSLNQSKQEPFIGLTDKGYLSCGSFWGGGSQTFYQYEGAAKYIEWDTVSLTFDSDYNNCFYSVQNTSGTRRLTEQEFNSVIDSYGSHYELSLTPLTSLNNSGSQDSKSEGGNSDDPLWEYKDTSNLIAIGKATPIGDVLSIRPYESDEVEALIKIPKGSYVGIVYFDGDWMYVKYYADYNSPIYYGYVRANKIEVTKYYQQDY